MGRSLKALFLGAGGRQAGGIVGSCGETFTSRATTVIVRLALLSVLPSFHFNEQGRFYFISPGQPGRKKTLAYGFCRVRLGVLLQTVRR